MLQNRYGDTEFPVRDRWSSARLYRQALLRTRPTWAAVRNLVWVVPAVVLLAVLLVSTNGLDRVPGGDGLGVLVLGGFALLVTAGLLGATWTDRRRPRLEQQRYWAAIGVPQVTERQQQLLALDAQSDYGFGGWNASLDYGPAWSRMPEAAQQRHLRDPRWQPFVTMPPLETERLRASLDDQWHIASRGDLELFVADALSEQSLSAKYRAVVASERGERMLSRVASLTGHDPWDLRGLLQGAGDRPAPALWGADSQRVVSVIRMGRLAGYVDEPFAWELIEHAAGPATSLFASWDEYWRNVRIGTAFWTDSLEAVQRFDHVLTGLRNSAWPAARVPFPASPLPAWLQRGAPSASDPVTD